MAIHSLRMRMIILSRRNPGPRAAIPAIAMFFAPLRWQSVTRKVGQRRPRSNIVADWLEAAQWAHTVTPARCRRGGRLRSEDAEERNGDRGPDVSIYSWCCKDESRHGLHGHRSEIRAEWGAGRARDRRLTRELGNRGGQARAPRMLTWVMGRFALPVLIGVSVTGRSLSGHRGAMVRTAATAKRRRQGAEERHCQGEDSAHASGAHSGPRAATDEHGGQDAR